MIVIPQVGAIPVGGQTFSQAERTVRARLSNLLKRFELHVSMARIRTIKVYVVGEVMRPGAYEFSALATASNALYAACGPTRSGSLRQVKVMREGKTVAELDFYDFLLREIDALISDCKPAMSCLFRRLVRWWRSVGRSNVRPFMK